MDRTGLGVIGMWFFTETCCITREMWHGAWSWWRIQLFFHALNALNRSIWIVFYLFNRHRPIWCHDFTKFWPHFAAGPSPPHSSASGVPVLKCLHPPHKANCLKASGRKTAVSVPRPTGRDVTKTDNETALPTAARYVPAVSKLVHRERTVYTNGIESLLEHEASLYQCNWSSNVHAYAYIHTYITYIHI